MQKIYRYRRSVYAEDRLRHSLNKMTYRLKRFTGAKDLKKKKIYRCRRLKDEENPQMPKIYRYVRSTDAGNLRKKKIHRC